MKKLVMVLPILALVFASIEISGDARVRPRVDVKDYGAYSDDDENSKTIDSYFLYRAKLDLKADIGNGWFFNTKLGTNAPAYWTGKFGDGDLPNDESLPSSGRGSISFMELYYGYKGDMAGVWGGVIPLAGHAGLDLHYYPEKVVDIPWLIYNNNATTGFAGYHKIFKRNLNWFVSIDNNVNNSQELLDGTELSNTDAVSIGLDYAYTFFGVDITSFLVKSFGSNGEASPITYGEHYSLPKFDGFTLGGTWAWTKNTAEKITTVIDENEADSLYYYNSEPYKGNILRIKLSKNIGHGAFLLWYDMANVSWTGSSKTSDDDVNVSIEKSGDFDYTYLWAHYKYVVHKSDFGEVSIKPTVQIDTKKSTDDDYSRMKFEITTEIKFK